MIMVGHAFQDQMEQLPQSVIVAFSGAVVKRFCGAGK
jgi:hypothetical protein